MSPDRTFPLGQALYAQTIMELKLLLRSGESLLVTLGVPLGVLVFFSTVDVLPTGDGDPVDFLVPGVLAISVMSTALVALAIQTAFERKYAVLKRLGGTPLPRWAFVVAKSLAVALLILVQTALVFTIAIAWLDWQPDGAVAVAVLAMLVGTIAFSALGLLMAGALRAEATLALSNTVYLVLLGISGLVFEADALPEPLATVGEVLPAGALGVALRGAFDGADSVSGISGGGALVVLLAWGVVATAATVRFFRWEP
ncbi:MAG: ABC transporter permease [Nitriliruptorales bacterium]|nr:ABC transporter permease [Nitriliruptorales bacterium]